MHAHIESDFSVEAAEICSLHCRSLAMNILVALITCKLDSQPHANIHTYTHTRDFINFTLRANMQILAE